MPITEKHKQLEEALKQEGYKVFYMKIRNGAKMIVKEGTFHIALCNNKVIESPTEVMVENIKQRMNNREVY